MDVFKFNSPTSPTLLEQGEIVDGFTSKIWIERYDKAGEFKFVSNASEGIKDKLPLGTIISHVDTTEIMIVENHEISDDKGKEPKLLTTGRGFETFFENRIVGWTGMFPKETSGAGDIHSLTTGEIWEHVVQLISDYVVVGEVFDPENAVPYLEVFTDLSDVVDPKIRKVERGLLYTRILELLKMGNLGIKVIRPGIWSPLGASTVNIAVEIHKGVDRSSEVIFSYDTGEIENADYLWSIKKKKTSALLTGKWLQVIYGLVEEGYDRRMMEIDAKSIDGEYTSIPTGSDYDLVIIQMHNLAVDTIASQTEIALTKAEVSRDVLNMKYRVDYEVGDLVMVSGDYNATSKMRIEEYVEIEDETGSKSYPTLATIP